jgi:hypothetical protein
MKNKAVLISGAGIAGPALAFWLKAAGFVPTIIEYAPTLRSGGYVIDSRGEAARMIVHANSRPTALSHDAAGVRAAAPVATLIAPSGDVLMWDLRHSFPNAHARMRQSRRASVLRRSAGAERLDLTTSCE